MRKILMNDKGEFEKQEKTDYFRSTAVKMVAAAIKKSRQDESKVEISRKALQRTSR